MIDRDYCESELKKLGKICGEKPVILYSNGILFDFIADNFDLAKYLNVQGVSDLRYETDFFDCYKGFKCIKPSEIKQYGCKQIIITSPNTKKITEYLKSNHLVSFGTKLLAFKEPEINENLIQNNYKKIIEKLKNKEKIRVLFVCEENTKWGYQQIYETFKNNSRFDVLPVVLFPIITKTRQDFTQKENADFFKKLGVETLDGYDYDKKQNKNLKSFEPDIVFYQQPWYLEGENHPAEVSKYALTVMIPYGYTTLSPKNWGSDSVKKVYSTLWKFFAESDYHKRFYQKVTKTKNKDIFCISGYTKFDEYKKTTQEFTPWKGENPVAKIIWAPHHTIGNNGLRMSTFKENYKFFLDFAKNNLQYSFILKPHPALKSACLSEGFMNSEEYDSYIENWCKLPNTNICTDGNYFELFKTSDVLITDCSSFLGEYFPTLNPIILLERKDRAPFDDFGKKLLKGFYRAENNDDINKFLDQLFVKKEDPLKKQREDIFRKNFFIPKDGASCFITKYITDLID